MAVAAGPAGVEEEEGDDEEGGEDHDDEEERFAADLEAPVVEDRVVPFRRLGVFGLHGSKRRPRRRGVSVSAEICGMLS